MLWKLWASLAVAVACLPAPAARAEEADEAETSGEAPDSGAAEAEPESEEPEDEGDDESTGYDRDGWYAGVGGGYAMELFDRGSSGDSGFMQLRGGYHFLRFAALELQLEYTPKFNGGTGRYAGVNTATWAAWMNAKGYPLAPWTGLVQPYALVGIAWMWERRTGATISGSDEGGGFASRFGGGIDLYVTKNIVVTAEGAYVLPTGSLDDLKQVQIGGALQYRF